MADYGTDITADLCRFVAEASYDMLAEAHVEKLKDLVVDHLGVAAGAAAGAESSEPFLQAVRALHGDAGRSTVYTKGAGFLPQWAGFLNAAYAHTFDFDDTHAASILHPGATAIPAALAQAELSGCDGRTFLLAVAVGYEVTTRIGRGLNFGGYTRGFHNTATAGIFGAVAAICKARGGLSTGQIENAFGLALSQASGSMQFLANGAWNKRLHPGFAVHDAFVSVALAAAGVPGAAEPLEGRYGLLHAYTATPAGGGTLTAGLGADWVFAATALKPFPACRMTHAAIELVARVARETRETRETREMPRDAADADAVADAVDAVAGFVVELSPGCFPIVAHEAGPNKRRPRTVVDAQFSIYFQVAVAWLLGADAGWPMYARLGDPAVEAWCRRVTAVAAPDLPDLAARVTFRFADGTERRELLVHPLGEAERPFPRARVHAKFLGMTQACYPEPTQQAILAAVERLDSGPVADLTRLL